MARKYNTGFEVVHDMKEACQDADVIYAKSWGPLMTTHDPAEGKRHPRSSTKTGLPMMN